MRIILDSLKLSLIIGLLVGGFSVIVYGWNVRMIWVCGMATVLMFLLLQLTRYRR